MEKAFRKRRSNYRHVKIHRSYTVEEAAAVLRVHKNTVRQWIKDGLPTCDDRRPTLVVGSDLREFLHARRARNKRPCGPGEIYCVRCHAPRIPAGDMADYEPITEKVGNLTGICPVCDLIMNRRVGLAKVEQVRGQMDIRFSEGKQHLLEREEPTVNSELR